MSSGFVSGGTIDAPIERDAEWLAAQQELEANRRRKAEQAKQADGRSLFDTLQANKAAKEDAFAEAAKLKNQFRSLDEDEIEFLDSVMESTRAEEDRVKKETAEGLAAFRRQQDEAEKKARENEGAGSPVEEQDSWTAGNARKRKRTKEKEAIKGVKLRKSSTSNHTPSKEATPQSNAEVEAPPRPVSTDVNSGSSRPVNPSSKTAVAVAPVKTGPCLVTYGSDSEDE